VAGVRTTIPFCRFVMQHEAFRTGRFSTGFVGTHFTPEALAPTPEAQRTAMLAAGLVALDARATPAAPAADRGPDGSRWTRRRYA
jgi:propionyl-CoA carboxylase alpha chain